MKKCIVCLIVLVMVSMASAGDWGVTYQNLFDMDNQVFDGGQGAQVQYQIPVGPIGIGLSAGYMSYEVNGQKWTEGRCIKTHYEFDGDVTDVPLGISILFDVDLNSWLRVGLDTGVKYHLLDSDITLDSRMWRFSDSQQVDIDNAITFHVAGNIEALLYKSDDCNIAGVIGGGYQWDLDSDQMSIGGRTSPLDNSLQGAFVQGGIVIRTK